VKAVRTPLLKDVHLMIDEPLEKLGDYVAGGADVVTVHAESCTISTASSNASARWRTPTTRRAASSAASR